MSELGLKIHDLAKKLFYICRSITGEGVRESLAIIQEEIPGLTIHEVPSGEKCFDWIVPKEWNIRDAYIIDPDGKKIVDFQQSNIHVINYSTPVNQTLSLDELQNHLYSLPEQPDAIPYVTSYYKERWGFCLTHKQRQSLKPGNYQVVIDSSLSQGSLTYGELILPGETEQEILISTYTCHPSLANDNLSGPCVTTFLAKWLMSLKSRRYTYRIVFIPESIGAIVYLSRHYQKMKQNTIAGFVMTCVGDEGAVSYLPSRDENTLADKVALHVLKHTAPDFNHYSFLDRGSDERQYCSPGVDLPVVSIMRSRYGVYPEYHTSLDNLDFITPKGLQVGYELTRLCLECLEGNEYPKLNVLCEPQLGRRGLYPSISTKETYAQIYNLNNLIAYCDGKRSLLEIADKINVPLWELVKILDQLKKAELIESNLDFSKISMEHP